MDIAHLIARLLLAAVFGVAGVAKLANRKTAQQALREFGIPASLISPFGILLPLAELTVMVSLFPVATAWWGALGGFALLLLFTGGIGITMLRGRRPACQCFGQLSSAPIGWSTLVRNGTLTMAAAFVMWPGRADVEPSVLDVLGTLTVNGAAVGVLSGVFALGLQAINGWFMVHMLRQNGRLLVRIEALETKSTGGSATILRAQSGNSNAPPPGLRVGTPAPNFIVPDIAGQELTLDMLRDSGRPILLIFSDPNCGPCAALLPEVARWQQNYAHALTIALISRGALETNDARYVQHGLTRVLLQRDREVAEAYQVSRTPSSVLVQVDGTIGSPLAEGPDAIRALVKHVLAPPAPIGAQARCPRCGQQHGNGTSTESISVQPSMVGTPAPEIKLPDLTGRIIDLADFRGRPTLVLFWNPNCGFCQQMLPNLKEWEKRPPDRRPQLLVVSTASVEASRAIDLRSPVVVDQASMAGQAFGAKGTPMAVLVNSEGIIASELATGAPAIMPLLTLP